MMRRVWADESAGGGVHDGGDGERRFCARRRPPCRRTILGRPPRDRGRRQRRLIIEDAGRAGRAGAEGAGECRGAFPGSRRARLLVTIPRMKKYVLLTAIATTCTVALYTGCTTNIKPIEPIHRVVMWVPDEPGTQTATESATQTASSRPVGSTTQVAEEQALTGAGALLTSAEVFTPKAERKTGPATQPGGGKVATPEAASTEAATQPTTEAAAGAATRPDHRGEHLVVKVIDPNQTSRYLYHGDYDNIWQQATKLLVEMGFTLDRKDYRLGVLTTQPLPSSAGGGAVEGGHDRRSKNAMENTIQHASGGRCG